MLEDVVNVPHRPKVDFYENHVLIIMQMVRTKETGSGVAGEQVSFVIGPEFLVTFQEEPEWDSFEPVRDRIWRGVGTIRNKGSDYLAYALLDTIVDSFFPVLETIGEDLEDLEDEVVERPTRATIEKIHRLRRGLMKLRRYIWPQRNVINSLIRDGGRTDQRRRAHLPPGRLRPHRPGGRYPRNLPRKSPPASWMCTSPPSATA